MYLPFDVVTLLSFACNVLVVAVDVIGIEFFDDTTEKGPENIFEFFNRCAVTISESRIP